jgi:hypothetical protein
MIIVMLARRHYFKASYKGIISCQIYKGDSQDLVIVMLARRHYFKASYKGIISCQIYKRDS